ncbi:MAG TPA: hypothetical protein VEC18_10615, partial [Myxococcota bacterium]|nr:hypothetical protein [Myxococcota bacterium]
MKLRETPLLIVSANRDRDSVVRALTRTGFAITDDLRQANLALEARLGTRKAGGPCGDVRNALFVLRERGATVLQIKGRGGTGACENNILDRLAQELARALESQWAADVPAALPREGSAPR